MGRKSTKENKNIYQIAREDMDLTREEASDLLDTISPERIEKIENEKVTVQPEDVVEMAECYKKPELCNFYCTHECAIGINNVPELELKNKSIERITLEVLHSLNQLDQERSRMIEIAVDGKIDKEEYEDFHRISKELHKMAISIQTLELWLDKSIADDEIDESIKEE